VSKSVAKSKIKPDVVLESLAYSIPAFSSVVGISVAMIYRNIDEKKLVPSYVNTKPLIMREEGLRWLRALPTERPDR
jgi:hypothetical protein